MEILIVIWALMLLACVLNLIRVDRFGKLLSAEISRVSITARLSGKYDVQWPNVQASYDNLKWYDIFNFKFASMIVYDTKY